MTPTINIYPDRAALTDAAAQHILQHAQTAIAARGHFHLVLAGGSTPKPVYEQLVNAPLDWSKVSFYWGDERCVPPDHADSNYRMAHAALLQHIEARAAGIYRMRGELPPEDAAADYEATLKTALGDNPFDLVLLGMGNDAHTASLFPHTAALTVTDRACVANKVEKLSTWRLTLTAPTLNAARHISFLITGADKAEPLHHVLYSPYQPAEYPSQLVNPKADNRSFFLDEAAAANLER